MAFDIAGAKKAGYSDAEIAVFLGQQNKFDVTSAVKSGYTYPEIINHLSKPVEKPTQAPESEFKAGLLSGTTLPADAPPMGNRMISEVGVEPSPITRDLPKFDVSKMPTEAEKAAATFGLNPEMGTGEKALRTAKAAAYGASTALQQTWLGGARIIADLSGTHQDDVKGVSKQLAKEQGAVEKTFEDNYGLKIAKNIGESVLSNVPTIYTGLAAGLPAAYTTMFGQSFLQTYDDSRNEGLNVAQSTARSALFGAAEVLGERIGLPTLFKGIKDIGAGVSAKELAKTAANFVMKDLAGEELTYLSQYLTDMGFGLNPQASLEQFFQGAVDTALVTVGQGAVMGGAGMASNKILKQIRKYSPEAEENAVLQKGKNVTVEGAPPIPPAPPAGTPPAGPQDLSKFKALEDQDIEEQDKERIDRLDALEAEFKSIDEKYKTATPAEFGDLNRRQGEITKEMNELIAGGVTPPAPKETTPPAAPTEVKTFAPITSVPNSAFNGDLEQSLYNVFNSKDYSGKPVQLSTRGFRQDEIDALEKAGLATNGSMSQNQFNQWDEERGNRVSGKSKENLSPAKTPPKAPTKETTDLTGLSFIDWLKAKGYRTLYEDPYISPDKNTGATLKKQWLEETGQAEGKKEAAPKAPEGPPEEGPLKRKTPAQAALDRLKPEFRTEFDNLKQEYKEITAKQLDAANRGEAADPALEARQTEIQTRVDELYNNKEYKKPLYKKLPSDPAIEKEALALADELEKIGDTVSSNGLRRSIANSGGYTDSKKLDYYKGKLLEAQQKAGVAEEMPKDKYSLDNYIRSGNKAEVKRFKEFLPKAPAEVQDLVAKSNGYLQAIADKVNSKGYKVSDILGSSSFNEMRDFRDLLSGIAGSTFRYVKDAEHIANKNRYANPEKMASSLKALENDFANADKLLGKKVEEEQKLSPAQKEQDEFAKNIRTDDDRFSLKDIQEAVKKLQKNETDYPVKIKAFKSIDQQSLLAVAEKNGFLSINKAGSVFPAYDAKTVEQNKRAYENAPDSFDKQKARALAQLKDKEATIEDFQKTRNISREYAEKAYDHYVDFFTKKYDYLRDGKYDLWDKLQKEHDQFEKRLQAVSKRVKPKEEKVEANKERQAKQREATKKEQKITVYHGTEAKFDRFDDTKLGTSEFAVQSSQLGHFFSSSKDEANKYGKNLVSANIEMANPYITSWDNVKEEDGLDLKNKLKKQGYDGVIIRDKGKPDYYVAFNSDQIKILPSKKEVHIEGKKEEPVTVEGIQKAVAKAGESVDYAKMKKAAENQVDQAIKRAKFATQKEYNDAKVPEAERYVTIKLEGDGSFKVMNNKERLEDFKKKLANAIKPKQAGTPRRDWESAAVGFKAESAVKNFLNDQEPDLAVAIANLTGLDITKVPLNPTQRKVLDRYIAEQKESGGEEPMYETIKSKPGANVARIAKLLGPQLYGSMSDITNVSVKEMLQNSFDAIKTMLEQKKTDSGKIDIVVDKDQRTVAITDDGSGMSPDTLANVFLTIAGTKKDTEFGSGAFGIAKLLFLFGNEDVEVITMEDDKISSMYAKGGQLMASLEDPSQAPDINIQTKKEMPDWANMFPKGHGTFVRVTVPKEFKDQSTGEMKEVSFPDNQYAFEVLQDSPLFANIEVTFNGSSVYGMGSKFNADEYTTFVDAKFDWGTARIYVSNGQASKYGENMKILSNGIWQFGEKIKIDPMNMYSDNIPHRFYLDIVSKVKPEEEGYPFQLNRQGFTKEAESDLKLIKNYLVLHYRLKDYNTTVQNFGTVQYLIRSGKNIVKSDQESLVPEIEEVEQKETIKEGSKVEVKDGKLIVNGKEVPLLTPDDLKKASIDVDALKVSQDKIDPNKVMIHDNLEVSTDTLASEIKEVEKLLENNYEERYALREKIGEEKDTDKLVVLRGELRELQKEQDRLISRKENLARQKTEEEFTPITKLARDKFGDRFDSFMFDIGDVFMALRDAVSKNMPADKRGIDYKDLAKEAIGVSFDKEYRGVSIVLPFKGMYINPAFPEYIDTPEEAALGMFGTMIHELAHHKVRNHGADFPAEMQRILIKLESSTSFDINQLKKDFILTVKENKDIIDFLNKEGSNESNRAIGQRFKDSSNQARGEDTSEDVSGQRKQGRGESGIPSELRPSYQAIGKKRQPEPVSSEDEDELESFREAYLAQREADGREDFKLKTSKSVKDMLLGSYAAAREAAKAVKESPMLAVNKMASKLDRAITYARIKGVWYGRGLEVAEVKKFNGQVKDGQDKAIATVALTNALHSGEIMSQVILRGKLMFDTESQMFRAEDAKESLANVMLAKHDLIERVGAQEANNMIQDYFEAKRSRSILDAFQKQEGIVEKAKEKAEKIEFGTDAYYDALDEVEKAKNDFYNIAVARSKVKLSDESIDIYSALEDDNPELRNMMDNWQAVNSNNLDNMEFSGLISKKRAKSLREIEDYVPWQRIQDEMDDVHSAPVRGSTKSLTNVAKEKVFKRNAAVNKAAREYIDGEIDLDQFNEAVQLYQENLGEIDDILDNMLHNTAVLGRNSMRNHAANMIAARYAERYTEGKKAGKLKLYREEGRDDNGVRLNIVVNGRRVIVNIPDPLIAEAVIGMENINMPAVEIFAVMANLLRRGITTWPQFQLRQLFMDAPTAAMVSGLGAKNSAILYADTFKSFLNALNSEDPIVRHLKAYGIGGFQSYTRSPEQQYKQQIGLIEQKKLDQFTNLLDKIGDASDMAQRIATYKRVLAETGDETLALIRSNNIIDFKKHGNAKIVVAITRSVSFMNAYAQQLDVLAEALAGGGLKGKNRAAAFGSMLKVAAMLTMWTTLYTWIMGGNDEYEKMDDQKKARNFVIPKNLTKYIGVEDNILLPMNTSAAYFFKAMPELITNYVIKKGTKNEVDGTRLRKALAEAALDSLLGPNPIATGIKPVVEIGLKRNFFTGGAITPKGLEGLDAAEQYNASTSELGKVLSAVAGGVLNPIEMDHLVRGIFGTNGAVVMWGSNMLSGDRPTAEQKDNPLWGGLMDRDVGRGPETLFYDLKSEVEPKHKTFMKLIEREKDEEADKYFKKHEKEIAAYEYVTGIESALKEINKEIRRVGEVRDPKFSKDDRRKEIQELQNTKNDILSDVIQIRKEAGL